MPHISGKKGSNWTITEHQEMLDVTPMLVPDWTWRETCSIKLGSIFEIFKLGGWKKWRDVHTHRWHRIKGEDDHCGRLPSLMLVEDEPATEDYPAITHYECAWCGQTIKPKWTGSARRYYTPGLKSWEGNADLYGDSVPPPLGQTIEINDFIEEVSGKALVTSWSPFGPGSLTGCNIEFQGTGELKYHAQ